MKKITYNRIKKAFENVEFTSIRSSLEIYPYHEFKYTVMYKDTPVAFGELQIPTTSILYENLMKLIAERGGIK